MQTYQKVGLVGGIITLVVSGLFSFVVAYILRSGILGRMITHYTPTLNRSEVLAMQMPFAFFAGIAIIGVIAGILGIVGSLTGSRVAGGVLLIIGAILSLPVFFGIIGIGFVLMLVAGILGLAGSQRVVVENRPPVTQTSAPSPTPPG